MLTLFLRSQKFRKEANTFFFGLTSIYSHFSTLVWLCFLSLTQSNLQDRNLEIRSSLILTDLSIFPSDL